MLELEDLVEVKVRDVERLPRPVEGQSTRIVEHGLEFPPVSTRASNSKLAEIGPSSVKELDPVVAGVSHGDEGSIRRDGHSPRVEKLSRSMSSDPKSVEVSPILGVQDLDAVIVLVRDEDPIRVSIEGEAGGSEELSSSSSSPSSNDKVQRSIRFVDDELVVDPIGDPELFRLGVVAESPGLASVLIHRSRSRSREL